MTNTQVAVAFFILIVLFIVFIVLALCGLGWGAGVMAFVCLVFLAPVASELDRHDANIRIERCEQVFLAQPSHAPPEAIHQYCKDQERNRR